MFENITPGRGDHKTNEAFILGSKDFTFLHFKYFLSI